MMEQFEKAFSYLEPKGRKLAYIQIRQYAKEFAFFVDRVCPDGREKSLALTKIEEAIMWANAGIARKDMGGEADEN